MGCYKSIAQKKTQEFHKISILPEYQNLDLRDYTCFLRELTKLSNPDSMGQILLNEA